MKVSIVTFENLAVADGQSLRIGQLIEHTASHWQIDLVARSTPVSAALSSHLTGYHRLAIGQGDALGTWVNHPEKVPNLLRVLWQIGRYVRTSDIVYTDLIFANFYSPQIPAQQCLTMEVNGIIGEELVNKGSLVRGQWKHRLFRHIERLGYQRADLLIAVSDGLRAYLIQEYGIPEARISVIPNAVDLDAFPLDEMGREVRQRYGLGDDPVAFFHGSFKSWHGLEHLVKAFWLVHDQVPNAHLMLVGDGQTRESIESLTKELGLGDYVIFAGMQPHREIYKYIGAADVCLYYPDYSVGDYGFLGNPIKFLEYMAMQKPIVTTRLRGFSEPVEKYQCGLVVAANYEDFARAVVALLKDSSLSVALGRNGRKAIEDNYSWPLIAERICSTSTAALAQKRASRK
jgi:glycosyltransferase involved in cell wall biosynthesis